jgi:hypothetical protein
MVQNGQEVYPGDSLARIPRATTKTKDSPVVCRASSSCSKRVIPVTKRSSPRSTAPCITDRWSRACAASSRWTKERATSTRCRASVHVNVQEGERVRASDPLSAMLAAARTGSDRPARRSGRARCQGTAALPGRQDPGGLPLAVRYHQRQAPRSHLPRDAAVGPRQACGRHRLPRHARIGGRESPADITPSAKGERTRATRLRQPDR